MRLGSSRSRISQLPARRKEISVCRHSTRRCQAEPAVTPRGSAPNTRDGKYAGARSRDTAAREQWRASRWSRCPKNDYIFRTDQYLGIGAVIHQRPALQTTERRLLPAHKVENRGTFPTVDAAWNQISQCYCVKLRHIAVLDYQSDA